MTPLLKRIAVLGLALCAAEIHAQQPARIDRQALVVRNSPSIRAVDPAAPFMVGNGNFAFTADITGLQTFPEQYSKLVPLMTQAQWAWHSFPNPQKFSLNDAQVPIDVRGKKQRYPALMNGDEAKNPRIQWLRENPHRFSLGRVSLYLKNAAGKTAEFADISKTRQTLELWRGRLISTFEFDGLPVEVETSVHPSLDILIVKVRSKLLSDGRLGIDVRFPGVNHNLNPDPQDWDHPETHSTKELQRGKRSLLLGRRLDDSRYEAGIWADQPVEIKSFAEHSYRVLTSGSGDLTVLVTFEGTRSDHLLPSADAARTAVTSYWYDYWTRGGVVDFAGSTDPRAAELERRVVLSQYLTAVNSAGDYPPQEEGLFSNSWNGKFHLEMHVWHAAHFAVWGRSYLLERSMPWYFEHLEEARARARTHGVRGAWWPKMVGADGRESPSTVNPFIMWQQPNPIYLSEVLYLADPRPATLKRYRSLVFETAELLASWPHFDKATDRYVLGPPIIPAQENFPPLTTFNPTFEIEYFRFGLETAQLWLERLNQPRNAKWDAVLAKLSKLPQKDGFYLSTESAPELWEQARSGQCSNGKTEPACLNRDHPSFLAALGFLPGHGVDPDTMRRTLAATLKDWDLRQTWGWDWPMLSMTATRLGDPQQAVDFLLWKSKNFQFGVSGMTPRVQLDENGAELLAAVAPDASGYRRAAETYFPSNGSLLLAVGLMASRDGFPKGDGWVVRSEGMEPMP